MVAGIITRAKVSRKSISSSCPIPLATSRDLWKDIYLWSSCLSMYTHLQARTFCFAIHGTNSHVWFQLRVAISSNISSFQFGSALAALTFVGTTEEAEIYNSIRSIDARLRTCYHSMPRWLKDKLYNIICQCWYAIIMIVAKSSSSSIELLSE